MTLKETLAALDAKATPGSVADNILFRQALVNAYRTGQLIVAPSVEELARVLCLELGRMGDTEAVESNRAETDWPRYVRTAKIILTSMGAKTDG